MTDIVLVAAVAENGVIGANGKLPWRVKADLRKFRALTMGKPLIMGRKTFDEIGHVLDGRDTIVVTRQRGFAPEGAFVAGSIEAALALAEERAAARGATEIAVVGGGEIYGATLARAARLYLTHIAARPAGDAYFPKIDADAWEEISREALPASEGDTATAVHAVYRRR